MAALNLQFVALAFYGHIWRRCHRVRNGVQMRSDQNLYGFMPRPPVHAPVNASLLPAYRNLCATVESQFGFYIRLKHSK